MVKASTITQKDIELVLKRQVKDDVRQLRRELAQQRINMNKVIGVGNMEDFASEWETDYAGCTTAPQQSKPKNKKLKRITKLKKNVKL